MTRPAPLRQTTHTTHTAADSTYGSRTWRPTMAIAITDSPDDNRYEARIDGRRAGIAEYMRTKESGLVVFTHTEVDPEYNGQGVGSALARAALDAARADGLKVLAVCPFITGWMARHPDYQDLAYQSRSKVED
ncbi:GNAT family N-acetyltransferase [Streptomyces sp. BH106]|uniref:GNAT family N-acetyltransferase n=1 Tax=Streptomyces sp. BH106 TaxID=3410409 RepID=UPI003CF982FA